MAYIYHNFYLKATRCAKGTADTSSCVFRNDRVSREDITSLSQIGPAMNLRVVTGLVFLYPFSR